MNTYRERLKYALDLAGMKQAHLARAAKISKASINDLLQARSHTMSAEHTLAAARVLLVDPHWLLAGEGTARDELLDVRLTLSPRAVRMGQQFDAVADPVRRDQIYAMFSQLLDMAAPGATPAADA